MPIGKYFSGHGKKVMADMKRRQIKKLGQKAGLKAAKRQFYATANKQGQKP